MTPQSLTKADVDFLSVAASFVSYNELCLAIIISSQLVFRQMIAIGGVIVS